MSSLDFRLLGPLEVTDGERKLALGGTRQRSVLAILLLHRGEVVSSDRLIDGLWGDHPPADASTALQQHVSRLRRQLEPHEVLVTRPPGYVLEIDHGQLDLERFRELRERGRRALDGGHAGEAAGLLREALEVWRGRPLADLESETFARDSIAELTEEHLAAVELRVEADLALGRHAELVGELRGLVRSHPLRERLRTQLMLSLYRAGRQSEALDVYADTRRRLVEELGLEPGPELQRLQQAVLAHDPALDPPRGEAATRKRRGLALAAATAAVLVAVIVAAAVVVRGGGEDEGVVAPVGGGFVAEVDPASGSVERRIPAGRTPAAIAIGDDVVWIVDGDARTLVRIVPTSRVVETLATGATPTDVAVGLGSVWVANGRRLETSQFAGPVATSIARLDPTTRTERTAVALPRPRGAVSNLVENRLAVGVDAAWVATPAGAVVRIDASTGAITAVFRDFAVAAVGSGDAGVWVVGLAGEVARLDERSGRALSRAAIPASSVGAIAVGDDAAWVTSPSDGTLWRIGGGRAASAGVIDLAPGVSDLAVGGGGVWVVNPTAGTLTQVDSATATVVRTIELGGTPRSVAADEEAVWIAVAPGPSGSVRSQAAGVQAFDDASTCEPVLAGPDGEADALIVSDLPLQGGVRLMTTQMTQAVAFVLREHGFRAGRFRVAYQSCDDSIARTGLFDEAKCVTNARAYAENLDVIGVIGTLNSPCAVAALPELNRAPGGALALVSPLNSFVGLTRPGPGIDPALPAALYPTGRRNYVRVFPTDDLQGAALALFASDRGHERVFVLDDGEPGYGALMATGFETAARRLGLDVSGRASWSPQRRAYADLAVRVARSQATAVFVGGLLDTNAAQVVRDLRGRLGTSVDILAPDGLTPLPLFVERAGDSALGVYVSLAGVVTQRLPPAGARFVRRFGTTQAGVEVEPSAVYAAQATEVLLDAIARSDGTRASVVEQLFRTRVANGLLGTFSFDRNGDISESPVTILRVRRGGGSNAIMSIEGSVVERVVRPSARLVAADE